MKSLLQFTFFVSVISTHLFSEEFMRTVSLRELLAPVEIKKTVEQPVAKPVDSVKPIKKPELRMISHEDVLDYLKARIQYDLSTEGKLSLSSRTEWNSQAIPVGVDWELVTDAPFSLDFSGRWYPVVELRVDGVTVSSQRLALRASLYEDVWTLKQNVSKGTELTQSSLEAVTVDVLAERRAPVPAYEDLAGYELERSLPAGRVLTWSDLKQQPDVRKNAVVEVFVDQGALQIRMRARAMDDGVVGDIVKLRNLDTNQEFFAAVRGKNRVEFKL